MLDFDGDGWEDLIACRLRSQTPVLYRNDGGRALVDVTAASGLTKTLADVVVADLNDDGRPDLVTAGRREFAYQLNTGTRFGPRVQIRSVPSGRESRSVAVGDADDDGDLDIYAMVASDQSNPDDVILVNDGRLGFTDLPVPSAVGQADEVVALDPHGNGRARFIVLNGGDVSGPVQLIEVTGGAGGGTGNTAPVVSAGADASVTLPDRTPLDGSVGDDGLPNPPAAVTSIWSKVSGPGSVTFADASSPDTDATFSQGSHHHPRLRAVPGRRVHDRGGEPHRRRPGSRRCRTVHHRGLEYLLATQDSGEGHLRAGVVADRRRPCGSATHT